ncbi:hypothetical protein SLEP1_g705 [Rubroshorea leprosula]|uniref:Reverse transcriptase domain-containing protein n=1 Tax=Rubroshorea leprosula TaxID=152421 RepID=A0AAV5HG60_9ROSI|nr:hypothetical protein SLEP1_g705 [Rubroshorea leprosula]
MESTRVMARGTATGKDSGYKQRQGHRNRAPIQPQDKDEEETSDKDEVKKRVKENMVMEYTPTGEELHCLEGGMVVVVRSLGLISEIQERVPLKAWGERCFQRIESKRIAKRIKLKVGDQLYEIEIVEEWRSDPDWWLSENDRKSDQKTKSNDYSVAWSQNEDPIMDMDVICDGDDASFGASGGLLCLWDRWHFVKREEFIGDGYVGISGEWGVNKQQCCLINVYGPNDRQKRAKLWEELRKMVIDKEGRWLIAGDFNAVRGLEERRYTWYKPNGTARSRLNRFLLNWGPRPFRVLDAWQQHPEFKKVVEDKWREMAVEGFAGYKCQQKLKLLKEFLKGWNKEVFGNMEAQHVQAIKKIEQVDMQNEVVDLEEFEIVKRQEGFFEMWDCLRKRELIWKQKSRSKWVREGDANTCFFHRVANGRRAQNSIAGLMCDGVWIEDPDVVKNETVKYFRSLFQGDSWNRPKPDGIKFQKIFEEKKEWLERPFSVEEIEEGLRSCDGSKAPGPDGYNFNFLKFAWHCIKEDFISFFSEFHWNGKLVRGLNSSFLALVPKKLNVVNLKDYRPISLIGCVYKLLAKVLANRLKSVMSEIVSETQSAFVGGRQLVDSVLVLNEVVDEIKNRKQPAFVFKADFEKAYDCINCPTKEFEVGKGLGQGDPLSPFLFLMIGEGLQGLFADDTIIMGRADAENIRMVKDVLRWFELMSGLRINFNKSSIYGYNVSERWLKGSAGMSEVDITTIECLRVSKLWRDIIRIGGQSLRLRNMLVEGFKWEVGEGNKVDFWQEWWVGDKILRDLCPRLYALSVKKKGKVFEMGSWDEGRWCRRVEWRRGTIGREKDEEVVLEKALDGV